MNLPYIMNQFFSQIFKLTEIIYNTQPINNINNKSFPDDRVLTNC